MVRIIHEIVGETYLTLPAFIFVSRLFIETAKFVNRDSWLVALHSRN